MSKLEILIFMSNNIRFQEEDEVGELITSKLLAVDRLATSAIVTREVSTLNHELEHDSIYNQTRPSTIFKERDVHLG